MSIVTLYTDYKRKTTEHNVKKTLNTKKGRYKTMNDLLELIDERFGDVLYNGGLDENEDPADYITLQEVLANV